MIVFRRKKDATGIFWNRANFSFQSPVSLVSEIQCEIFPQMDEFRMQNPIQESSSSLSSLSYCNLSDNRTSSLKTTTYSTHGSTTSLNEE